MSASQPLRVAVIGAGAFGRNHLRVFHQLQHEGQAVELVGVVDRASAVLAEASAKFGIPGFETIEACLAAVGPLNAASVCVPTVHHASAAAPLLTAGVDLLIEKPFAASLEDADRVLELANKHGRIVQVGHLERFNPAVTAARQHLHKPMFFEAHRLSIFTPRSLDVDVVLDLMIHDLDIVLSLVASPVREVRAVGLPVLSNKVDIANVRVEFENGCIANFTASRISTERVRKLRFFQPHQYLSLDFARQDLLMIDVTAAAGMDPRQLAQIVEKAQTAEMAKAAQQATENLQKPQQANKVETTPSQQADKSEKVQQPQQAGQHPSAGLSLKKVSVEPGEPLRLEIESFLQAVRTRTTPLVSGEAGRAALSLALEINTAIATHAKRAGL